MSRFFEQQQAAERAENAIEQERSAWRCVKCKHHAAQIGESRQSGSGLASVFDIEGLRFTMVSCKRCGFTEFYKADADALTALFDFGIG